MAKANPSPGARALESWRRLSRRPGGKWLYSRLVSLTVPYTGSIGAKVESLEPGHVVVSLRDRRRVRNHLASIHAVALINLGEFTSGLAMLTGLPTSVRGIVTQLSGEFIKKARGRLMADCQCRPPEVRETADYPVVAEIRNADDEVVARVTTHWRLAPK
ncbi:MAG: hotdog fold domain-containing protein [Acidobacteriota bacterium]